MPADTPSETSVLVDGVWRPEPWTNGRFLLVRYVETATGVAKRQVNNGSEHSAFAVIYESQATAAADAQRLNEAAIAALIPPESPPDETEENDQ